MTYKEIKFRKAGDKRTRTGYLAGTLSNGNLKVHEMHRAARGGSWVATVVAVKPSQVIES